MQAARQNREAQSAMETIFTLPLALVAALQILLSLLLLSPRALSLPLAQLLSKAGKGTAARSILGTVCMLLLGLFVASFLEVLRGSQRVQRDDLRVDLSTMDYFRSQTSCVLCVLNLMLVLLNPALAESLRAKEHAAVSLDAIKRQVKGLQAEYERVTAKPSDGVASGTGEAALLQSKIDRLIREKGEQQAKLEAAEKASVTSEAKLAAMIKQVQGMDKEFDRVLDDNKALQRRLAAVDGSAALGMMSGGSSGVVFGTAKKDD